MSDLASIAQLLGDAIAHHKADRLEQAEQGYLAILRMAPAHADANHNLGLLAARSGREQQALAYFAAALAAEPQRGQFAVSYATVLTASGDAVGASALLEAARARGVALPQPGEPPAAVRAALQELFKAGQYAQVEAQARHLSEQYPASGFGWKLLGAALQQQGKDSLAALDMAARRLPDDAAAQLNLALALQQRSLPEPSVEFSRRAVALQPALPEAHNTLGLGLRALGQLDQAGASFARALALKPDYVNAHRNLSSTLKDAGQFERAIEHARRAIDLLVAAYGDAPPPQRDPVRGPDTRAAARAVLDLLRATLERAAIPWCLYAGTMLGIYRDGDLLPNDKDMDLALPADVPRAALIEALTAAGFRLHRQHVVNQESRFTYSLTMVHAEHKVPVDLFFLQPDGADHFLSGVDHPVQPLLCRLRRFDFVPHRWRGGDWPIPSDPEQFLAQVYGPGWSQPDPAFDTVISNPARVPEAIPAVLSYGYGHLAGTLQAHNWRRSAAYCRQLLARRPDPLLDQVLAWLARHDSAR